MSEDYSMLQESDSVWSGDEGQDVAEWAIMVVLVLTILYGVIDWHADYAPNVFAPTAATNK